MNSTIRQHLEDNPYPRAETPGDCLWRSLVIAVKHYCGRGEHSDQILSRTYGSDDRIKKLLQVLTRAASVPADTLTSGWAAQLVSSAIGEFFAALTPVSIYPRLAAIGGRFGFGRNGVLFLPTRNNTPTIAGSFVAEGAPIPVRQAGFGAIALTPKKMGVISAVSREISEHSTPDIEGLIKQAVVQDTAVSLDSVLLDDQPATEVRPAGIRYGVTATPAATTGTALEKATADLKNLIGTVLEQTNGNVGALTWLLHPADALALMFVTATDGSFPFKPELAAGTLFAIPVIRSPNVPMGMMILMDAADFASATGDAPRFFVSGQAVVHMEDTDPQPIATPPGTLASPVHSMWQTSTIGIRMTMDLSWGLRRAGSVAWLTGMTWN